MAIALLSAAARGSTPWSIHQPQPSVASTAMVHPFVAITGVAEAFGDRHRCECGIGPENSAEHRQKWSKMVNLGRSHLRRWRSVPLGGPLQRACRFCFAAHDGQARTSARAGRSIR